jgi:hypothetical protein
MKKKAIVLKSLRTAKGASDWAQIMAKHYPNAKVVDTDTLKSYHSVTGDTGSIGALSSHVIMEESMTPGIRVNTNGEVAQVIKSLTDSGYMSVNDQGRVSLTKAWHDDVNALVAFALQPSFKSVDDNTVEYTGKLRNHATVLLMKAIGAVQLVFKSLEDSEKLAKLGEPTENDEFGHELRPNKKISDAEAKAAFEGDAKAADTQDKKMKGQKVTDAAVRTATGVTKKA